MKISLGFQPEERPLVAALYWQAFGAKLGKVLGPTERALPFFERILDPSFALVARDADNRLLGLAGFKTKDGGLIEGGFSDMVRSYGVLGSLWRAVLLSMLERKLQDGVFQMDGIFVAEYARGQGVGTALLDGICDLAKTKGARSVQLDVIDTNPRAKALYERVGFEAVKTEETGPLKWVFGFASATRMERSVKA